MIWCSFKFMPVRSPQTNYSIRFRMRARLSVAHNRILIWANMDTGAQVLFVLFIVGVFFLLRRSRRKKNTTQIKTKQLSISHSANFSARNLRHPNKPPMGKRLTSNYILCERAADFWRFFILLFLPPKFAVVPNSLCVAFGILSWFLCYSAEHLYNFSVFICFAILSCLFICYDVSVVKVNQMNFYVFFMLHHSNPDTVTIQLRAFFPWFSYFFHEAKLVPAHKTMYNCNYCGDCCCSLSLSLFFISNS